MADKSEQIHQKADELFDGNKFEELLQYLTEQESWYDNSELLWRVARCKFQLSKLDDKKKNELVKNAYDNVVPSLELNDNCGPAHKWAAILLDASSTLDGTKARIEQTLNVRKHMEKAVELMPKDGTARYLLGEWHYGVCNVSWLEKKIASVVFATLPDASLDAALAMFEEAEKVEPGFWSKNQVMLAKTLMGLKRDTDQAKAALLGVVEKYKDSEKWDDKEAVKEAKDLLYKLGVKI